MRLEEKVAIITGAGSGIAKNIAFRFAKEGCAVICADIKGEEETAAKINEAGGRALAIKSDVSSLNSWEELLKKTIDEFGTVNILCNIAGISEAVDIVDLTEEQFDNMINVNLKGVFFGMKVVLPELVKNGYGKIINIASLAAHVGLTGLPSYSASKGGVISLSRQVAMDYADQNIQINVVSPGIIETPILANNPPEVTKAFTDATPIGRLGKPDEIGNMVLFLASEESDFVTGQAIKVDGGWGSK
ncbi:SDR family NAD(P)-dependent oxidoreductase [Desertibacillus haloalkaliphilus]|uniref:SDR family NAD(P)-dependent oxidoreductase n=1 Tax=Desertibacillus haloalkaliphilus TaxID=1328930 RepID=UPI001C273658|nr:SDR family NAD(P)-dependent oxidoreductase [Desertibacillus haloalkaliphilus]MBU8905793.1 SDR family oxidoreductase [Desertibacillus haloalkaliphilus]